MNERGGRASVIAAAGVIALVFPFAVLVPVFNLLMIFGIAAVYYLWFARSWSWLAQGVLAAIALTWALGDGMRTLILMLIVMIPGMIMTSLRFRRRGLSVSLIVALAFPLLLAVGFNNVTANLVTAFGDQMRAVVQSPQMVQIYSPSDYQLAVEYVNVLADNAMYYWPAAMLATLLLICLLGALIGEKLVERQGLFAYRIPPFTLWKLDEWMVLPVGLAIIAVLAGNEALAVIGWNSLVLLFLIYSVFGLSFIEYQMRTRSFPVLVRVVIYVFLFLTQLLGAVVLPLLALFDAKFDFRKIRAKQLG